MARPARIELRFCALEFTPDGACTVFPDGSRWGAQPHETPAYYAITARLGYEEDILTYCRHHEVAHNLVAEAFNSHSMVLWPLAHGDKPCAAFAAAEEALALALQRYAMTHEHPMIDRVDWKALKTRFLEAVELLASQDGPENRTQS